MNRILVIDKPSGMTSHDVVSRLRRSTGTRRIGHAGTLDPSATGVLVVLVGKATRLSQFLMETTKEYSGSIVLGVSTDTQDSEGRILSERPVDGVDAGSVRRVLSEFTGAIQQVPPMVSALKRNGRPLYELARKGVTVERDARAITVEAFDLVRYEPPRIFFDMTCSKGTYVRTIASDVGERLGTGGHLGELKRTRVGRFSIADALSLCDAEALRDGIDSAGFSMFDALAPWPDVTLDDDQAETVMSGGGVTFPARALAGRSGEHVRLTRDGVSLLAVARVDGDSHSDDVTLRPVRVFEAL